MPRARFDLLPCLLAVAAACGGGAEPPGPPTALAAIEPGPFTGTVGEPLAAPLRVRVTDANGRGVPGVAVRYAVTSGDGSVGGGGIPATSFTDSTDQDGAAEAQWTLGTGAGTQTANASVTGVASLTFTATAEAGPAAAGVITTASAFIAPVSEPTDEPLAIRVEDLYGNPVAGVAVAWAAISAGASVAAATTTSNANGVATVGATLGAAPGIQLFRYTPAGGATDTVGVIAVTAVTDPTGDQAAVVDPAYASHDVTRFGAVVIQDILVLYARFAGPVTANPPGAPTATSMIASYDLDLDGDSLTGYYTLRQCLGGDSLGFGTDAFVDLDPNTAYLSGEPGVEAGSVAVLRVDELLEADRCTSSFNGAILAVVPVYQPTTVSIGIPLAFLMDDGAVNITSLFAHPATVITDIVPDSLAFEFVPVATASGAPGAVIQDPWVFLSVARPQVKAVRVEGMPILRRPPGGRP